MQLRDKEISYFNFSGKIFRNKDLEQFDRLKINPLNEQDYKMYEAKMLRMHHVKNYSEITTEMLLSEKLPH